MDERHPGLLQLPHSQNRSRRSRRRRHALAALSPLLFSTGGTSCSWPAWRQRPSTWRSPPTTSPRRASSTSSERSRRPRLQSSTALAWAAPSIAHGLAWLLRPRPAPPLAAGAPPRPPAQQAGLHRGALRRALGRLQPVWPPDRGAPGRRLLGGRQPQHGCVSTAAFYKMHINASVFLCAPATKPDSCMCACRMSL